MEYHLPKNQSKDRRDRASNPMPCMTVSSFTNFTTTNVFFIVGIAGKGQILFPTSIPNQGKTAEAVQD